MNLIFKNFVPIIPSYISKHDFCKVAEKSLMEFATLTQGERYNVVNTEKCHPSRYFLQQNDQ